MNIINALIERTKILSLGASISILSLSYLQFIITNLELYDLLIFLQSFPKFLRKQIRATFCLYFFFRFRFRLSFLPHCVLLGLFSIITLTCFSSLYWLLFIWNLRYFFSSCRIITLIYLSSNFRDDVSLCQCVTLVISGDLKNFMLFFCSQNPCPIFDLRTINSHLPKFFLFVIQIYLFLNIESITSDFLHFITFYLRYIL